MLSEFFSILWKNFRIVFRTPSLLFLVIIGPLTLILLVGTAFSNSTPDGALVGDVC
jgi:predicted permease